MLSWTNLKNKIYRYSGSITTGIYSDEYWKAPKDLIANTRKICEENEYTFEILGTHYEENEEGNPIRKTWLIAITDPKSKERFGRIVAAGAENCANPLSRYDVVLMIT